jgi:hypothetical protein
MKTLTLIAFFISPSAFAYGYYNTTTQHIGNTTYTNTYGNGYNSNITTQRIGNTTYSNGSDNQGNRVNCTTQTVGGYSYTTCN